MATTHWQAVRLTDEVKQADCDILFTADASTLCRFKPQVVFSQDMLSYEPGVMRQFGWGKARLRLSHLMVTKHGFSSCRRRHISDPLCRKRDSAIMRAAAQSGVYSARGWQ